MRNKKINNNDTKPLIQRLLYYAYKFIELKQDEHKHFHPSADLHCSEQDTMLTQRMIDICDLVGIPLVDSIIVGGDNSQYFSFKEKNMLPMPRRNIVRDYHDVEFKLPVAAELKEYFAEPDKGGKKR